MYRWYEPDAALAAARIGHDQADKIVATLEAGAVADAHTRISESSPPRGAVTLLGVLVPDGASGRGGFVVRIWGQAVVGRPVTPVIWSQMAKRTVISAR